MRERKPNSKQITIRAIAGAALFAGTFVFLNIPAEPVVGPSILDPGKFGPHFETFVETMVHGWPFTWLRHHGFYASFGSGPSAWLIGDNPLVDFMAIIGNMSLLMFGTIAFGWVLHRRIQKHRWRFGVIHLMTAMLCTSLVAAWATARIRLHRAQLRFLEVHNSHGVDWQPCGPFWLRNITQAPYWSLGDRLVAITLEHSDEIAELPGKHAIKVLRMYTVNGDAMPSLDEYRSLLAIDMSMINDEYSDFDGDGYQDDDDIPKFRPYLSVIAECGSLQGLNLYDNGVTDRGLQELGLLKNLIHLNLSVNRDVTDQGLVHLESMRSLKMLGLWGTSVTKEGVAKLKTALPDCEIGWDE